MQVLNSSDFLSNLCWKILTIFPDKWFLSLKYFKNFKRFPNLSNPQTFNEKLNWLKLYDRQPYYTQLVDKIRVKQYVANLIGEQYVIPTLGIWDCAEDIDFELLPDKFVLKANHDSGHVIICKDKSQIEKKKIIREMKSALNRDFYAITREWPYKNVKRQILAEQYLEDTTLRELRDYKFFCFNGEVKVMFIATDRQRLKEPYFDFFTTEFEHLDIQQGHPNRPQLPQRPISLNEMISLAQVLSANIPHVRVDFYEIDGRPYFGEMTFYHFSGSVPFLPESWDNTFGEWISLP